MTDRSELIARLKPFPARLVHDNPGGRGTYVKHSVVVQRLLDLFGSYDFEVVTVLRGHVAATGTKPDLEDAVVGAVCRLTVLIDGQRCVIEDVGDCEQPHNWPHDGARLKDATSDAIKRCAARLGVGIGLWAGDEAYLYDQLVAQEAKT